MRSTHKKRAAARDRYIERVNLAIDFAVRNLARPNRLTAVARVAGLSPFHFHRVFQAMVGETLADFVQRRRLERAVTIMARPRRPALTRIALDCGFNSSSDFSRCFRRRFGVAPSRFDLDAWRASHGAEWQRIAAPALAAPTLPPAAPPAANPDGFRASIRDLPARTVAYIRVHDPYRPDAVPDAARRLVAWAQRRGWADRPWLGYQWEHPEITSLDACQYHVAVEADDFAPTGEVGLFRFPAMTVAQVGVRGGIDVEIRALIWLYGVWLPRSGYVPDDHPCFEAWIGRPFAHGTTHFELHAQLPVRRWSTRL